MAAKLAARIKAQTKVVQVPGLQCENVRAVHTGVHLTRVIRQHRVPFLGSCTLPFCRKSMNCRLCLLGLTPFEPWYEVCFPSRRARRTQCYEAVMETCAESEHEGGTGRAQRAVWQRMPWHFLLTSIFPAVRLPSGPPASI